MYRYTVDCHIILTFGLAIYIYIPDQTPTIPIYLSYSPPRISYRAYGTYSCTKCVRSQLSSAALHCDAGRWCCSHAHSALCALWRWHTIALWHGNIYIFQTKPLPNPYIYRRPIVTFIWHSTVPTCIYFQITTPSLESRLRRPATTATIWIYIVIDLQVRIVFTVYQGYAVLM